MYILSDRNKKKNHHVSYDTILGLEDEFSHFDNNKIVNFSTGWVNILNCLFRKFRIKLRIIDQNIDKGKGVYFYASMGYYDLFEHKKDLRFLIKKGYKVCIYLFDVWENQYKLFEDLFSYIKPSYIFLAYYNACNYFKSIGYNNCYVLPQSMNSSYFIKKNVNKERLFMQMGRKNSTIHEYILNYLNHNGIVDDDTNYVYERVKGQIIFPETNKLVEEICKSYFFVCAPKCKENNGNETITSDVTARFYEAMACGTLIIGYKPETFDLIFKDAIMIDVKNQDDFNLKVKYFLNNKEEYKKIVEKNMKELYERHTWTERLRYIDEIINQD